LRFSKVSKNIEKYRNIETIKTPSSVAIFDYAFGGRQRALLYSANGKRRGSSKLGDISEIDVD